MKYKVENNHDDKVLIMTEDEWRRLIGTYANQYNYGRCRHWKTGTGVLYWDCGPKTFKITPIFEGDAPQN